MSATTLTSVGRYHAVLRDLGPEAVGAMREITRILLRLWAKERLCDKADLGVSELLTNVLNHAPGDCELLVDETPQGVDIAVSDFSDALPVVKEVAWDATSGRGLFMLSLLADSLEILLLARGKQVRLQPRLAEPDDEEKEELC